MCHGNARRSEGDAPSSPGSQSGFVVALDPTSELPVYLQIARAIADDVRRARLRAGDALPGSRTLARTLNVHRNTVLAAYTELVSEGWVTTEMAGGTFIAADPPTHSRLGGLRSGLAPAPAYPLAAPLFNDNPPTYRPGFLLMARGPTRCAAAPDRRDRPRLSPRTGARRP